MSSHQPAKQILVTGFNAFGDLAVNPSEAVVAALERRNLPGIELVGAVLSTEYRAATIRLRRLIRVLRPDAVVCLGVARGRTALHLERVALNLDDSDAPDNAAAVRRGVHIARSGPAAYWSTLPLAAMLAALRRAGHSAEISNHAGTFLCNHVFYVAHHLIESENLDSACGFLHLPSQRANGRPWATSSLTEAVVTCLEVVARRAGRRR